MHTADRRGKKLEIMPWHMIFGRYRNCYGALAELKRNNPQLGDNEEMNSL